MISLSNLSPNIGSNRKRKRVGRGPGSGRGKTATRGHKGANSRSGASVRPGFEGGQMPLQRRLPKRGFHSKFKTIYSIVSLTQLNNLDVTGDINAEVLYRAGLVKNDQPIKVLANGEITKAIILHIDKISQEAKAKIESVGGNVFEAISL
ncbi:MAG: LSU ribosomal protein [Desulfobulbaceae bacterium]|jgi:large subunit ribosomal protein L15|nr:MAG: LSU ribosomal protein [Desulfobulbaceae bacterium]